MSSKGVGIAWTSIGAKWSRNEVKTAFWSCCTGTRVMAVPEGFGGTLVEKKTKTRVLLAIVQVYKEELDPKVNERVGALGSAIQRAYAKISRKKAKLVQIVAARGVEV
uniref:Uncharacterized protein n=1 Tax=Ananas comosus var. bracteatus TaxID=296719 RepID=A0A6V7Q8X4_ANACO|nr:unnamed protein product [Ananas comosus var. bracteatus]